ncbi:MAG TPA: DUF488 domain-containing protein [Brevundimonas sp.]|jgi:uncharacterized protein (DUF488 family)|uniref:DUF488 domain-containing protein n=1 Tax=Brevundimonas sp. TaxID=1871086 RepID=UPI002BA5471F|nr:DUF488 domain-containing protein [Brevundimonas sp.]HRH19016.1 DUF488 domain-containing protein [Brevundimonas sp.]
MLATIGYEGARLEDFLATLKAVDVDMVVDIRDRAQSRRAGFSKTALSEALATQGIDYLHLKDLGDPKPGREAARAGDFDQFRAIYRKVMAGSSAKAAMTQVVELLNGRSVCLLCYERDHHTCHRKLVADHIESVVGLKARHLGVNANVATSGFAGRVRDPRQSASA